MVYWFLIESIYVHIIKFCSVWLDIYPASKFESSLAWYLRAHQWGLIKGNFSNANYVVVKFLPRLINSIFFFVINTSL